MTSRTADKPSDTPMMRQYKSHKAKHPDAILFFRMGDFYEMFFEDARLAAEILGLTLTTRDKGKPNAVPMAGVPWHAAEGYIARLVRQGHRVAVCEQVGDPAASKGIVERKVVEVVTPGTALTDGLTRENRNNFVAALLPGDGVVGFAAADATTGEFLIEDLEADRWAEDAARLDIGEWLLPEESSLSQQIPAASAVERPGWWFDSSRGRERLKEQFGVRSLKGFDCDQLGPGLGAAGALLEYLQEVRDAKLPHFVRAGRFGVADFMVLDATTRRNLELESSPAGPKTTLMGTIDHTLTALGARKLRTWLDQPLLEPARINRRLDAVEELMARPTEAGELRELLSGFRDLKRLLAKAAAQKLNPRELRALGEGAEQSPALKRRLGVFQSERLAAVEVPDLEELGRVILEAVVQDPPLQVTEGGIFNPGWNKDLDEYRQRTAGGKDWIAGLQRQEREATGIPNLKVGFNRVFGYYLEVSKSHQDKVPSDYIRKQTLVNAERYITPELKEEEEKILGAEEKLKALEQQLYGDLRDRVVREAQNIQVLADAVADADALASLAEAASRLGYIRPEITDELVLEITAGRHPVVERLLEPGDFVPNDTNLDVEARQIALITGPNMGGKSTYLRQNALIAILAQLGSYVPAEKARVGIVDRIFSRVGASDSIAEGQSTFMVEMEETAVILNRASSRSLVLLDEVGRGTSTYDGLSLAWAVTEFLHESPGRTPRTLFATHYHELTQLAGTLPRVVNLNVLVREWNDSIVFLRKIVTGAADRSYGIHVAELAGLPPAAIERAKEILHQLESGRFGAVATAAGAGEPQLQLFEPRGIELLDELRNLKPEAMTPLEALERISRWKKQYDGR